MLRRNSLPYVLLALAALTFASLACGSTPAGGPTMTPLPNHAGPGYLWRAINHTVDIPVVGMMHQNMAATEDQFQLWVAQGEACWAKAGTKVGPDSFTSPWATWPIQVLDGPCRGFRGWVSDETWQDKPLP